MQLAHLHDM